MSKSQNIPNRFSENFLEKLDYRTSLAQTIRGRLAELANDLGGMDTLSYQERSLCKRIIWLEATIEIQEAALSRGEDIEHGKLSQSVNTLIGLLKTIGLERRSKELSLSDFIKAKQTA